MKKKYFFTVIFSVTLALSCFAVRNAFAMTTVTWTNGGGTNSWTTATNWSGGVVPWATSTALFSASSTANCNISTGGTTVGGIQINAGYTGTLTLLQNGVDTLAVGTSGISQVAGTFTASTGTITNLGIFSITGGTFNASTSVVSLSGTSTTITPSSFNANSSTVVIKATSTLITGSSTFYNLTFITPGSAFSASTNTIATGTVLTVLNQLGLAGDPINSGSANEAPSFYGGTIKVQGNIVGPQDGGVYADPGTTQIMLTGAGAQTIGQGGSNIAFPSNFMINKPSGALTFAGTLVFPLYGTWTNLSGTTITPGTSMVEFTNWTVATGTQSLVMSGSSTFYNFQILADSYDAPRAFNIVSSSVMTIKGTMTLQYNSSLYSMPFLGNGTFNIQGDVQGHGSTVDATSSVQFVLNGTNDQNVGGINPGDTVYVPNLTISKASDNSNGYFTLSDTIIDEGGFTNTTGTPMRPGSSSFNVNLFGSSTIPTITGTASLYKLQFTGAASTLGSVTIATGTTVTVKNGLGNMINSGNVKYLGGGSINVAGDINGVSSIIGSQYASGVTVNLNGTSTQTIAGALGSHIEVQLPNVTVNNTSSLVSINPNSWVEMGKLTLQKGEFKLAVGQAGVASTLKVDGALTVNTGTILSGYPIASSTLSLGSNVVNNGTIFFDGSGVNCGASMPNYLMLVSTSTGVQIPWTGSGNFIMRYIAVTDQGSAGGAFISVLNGTGNSTSSDDGTNWTFTKGNVPQFVQATSTYGPKGTTSLTLPLTREWPRQGDLLFVAVSAANQAILAPTDTAGNTYVLISSSTFDSAPTHELSLYYVKNVTTTESFQITINTTSSAGNPELSAWVGEYTGLTTSSTLDTYSTNGSAFTRILYTNFLTGNYLSELYVAAMTYGGQVGAIDISSWNSEAMLPETSTTQSLYFDDITAATTTSQQGTWSALASTSYAAVIAAFKPPQASNVSPSGSLDSQTFDTRLTGGTQLNSFIWQGVQPALTTVNFQFAGSNSSNGPWNFLGPDGTINTGFTGTAGTPIPISFYGHSLSLMSGYRYFRYRVNLGADPTLQFTPTISQVTLNWSQ